MHVAFLLSCDRSVRLPDLSVAIFGSAPSPSMQGFAFNTFFDVRNLADASMRRKLTKSNSDPTGKKPSNLTHYDSELAPLKNCRAAAYIVKKPHDENCTRGCPHFVRGHCAKGHLCQNCHDPSHTWVPRH